MTEEKSNEIGERGSIASGIGGGKDQRKSYTCSFKLKVVEYAERYSNSKAAEEYGVHRRRVQEWKNQKNRLVEQVQNFNGSTKRLKGGGRRKINPTKEKDFDFEKVLSEHLMCLVKEGGINLDKQLVVREAKIIDPNFTGGTKWAGAFLERFLLQIDDDGTAKKKAVSADLDDFELDHYFEQVSKDEMRIVRHLEKKLLGFVERCADRITLSELVYKEAKKHSHLFEITPIWVSEFLDLHAGFIHENSRRRRRRPSSPLIVVDDFKRELSPHEEDMFYRQERRDLYDDDRDWKPEMYLNKEGEYFYRGNPVKRRKIFDAFRSSMFTIHDLMDRWLEEDEEFDMYQSFN